MTTENEQTTQEQLDELRNHIGILHKVIMKLEGTVYSMMDCSPIFDNVKTVEDAFVEESAMEASK